MIPLSLQPVRLCFGTRHRAFSPRVAAYSQGDLAAAPKSWVLDPKEFSGYSRGKHTLKTHEKRKGCGSGSRAR